MLLPQRSQVPLPVPTLWAINCLVPAAQSGQKRALDPGSGAMVCCLKWVLGTKPQSLEMAVSVCFYLQSHLFSPNRNILSSNELAVVKQ